MLGRPTLKEIADGPSIYTSWSNHLQLTVSSIRAYGNRSGTPARRSADMGTSPSDNEKEKPYSSDGRLSNSSNQDKIITLFRGIRTSIAKGESTTSKKRNSNSSTDKSWSESVLEVLNQSRKPKEEKDSKIKSDKLLAGWKGELQKVEEMVYPATAKIKLTRPPSSFVKRSPIPKKVEDEQKREASSAKAPKVLENLEDMKLPALKELAKSRGIRGYSKLKKGELLELLRA